MSKNKNVVARFKRVIERNFQSERYRHLTREVIEQAMIDALNTGLPNILGNSYQSFYAYWDNDDIKVRVTRLIPRISEENRYYFFNLNLLGETNIRAILHEFQGYLDYIENKILYEKIKPLKNGLLYGSVVRYENDVATIEFYTDDGDVMYGFCAKRHLITNNRDFQILRKKESMLFYVRDIKLHSNSRLEIQLSNKSIRIPELLLKKTLQEYGYELKEYPMKCIYRIPGKFCKIVVLNRVDKDVVSAVKDELCGEAIRIIPIDNKVDINKFVNKLISFQSLAEQYDINNKIKYNKVLNKNKQKSLTNTSANSIADSIINKFKGAGA